MTTLGRRDAGAAALTALAVLTFFATHQSWNVPLVGDSHRWAAGAISILGIAACSLGTPDRTVGRRFLAVLGVIAAGLAVVAIATGSLTVLSLLVVDFVLLWVGSTVGHVQYGGRRPLPS